MESGFLPELGTIASFPADVYKRQAKEGSQFLIASHSPILLGLPEAEILSFDGNTIEKISYEDTESYAITEMFINNREVLIKHLLE